MVFSSWIGQHWFDLLQTTGIVGGLIFTAYSIRKDEQARRISNSIALNAHHHEIWKELYSYPQLFRIMAKDLDLKSAPVSEREELFTKTVIVHLSTAYRAMKHGEFVKLEGLSRDVKTFFSLPIPRAVWRKIKEFHDRDFIDFIDRVLK